MSRNKPTTPKGASDGFLSLSVALPKPLAQLALVASPGFRQILEDKIAAIMASEEGLELLHLASSAEINALRVPLDLPPAGSKTARRGKAEAAIPARENSEPAPRAESASEAKETKAPSSNEAVAPKPAGGSTTVNLAKSPAPSPSTPAAIPKVAAREGDDTLAKSAK